MPDDELISKVKVNNGDGTYSFYDIKDRVSGYSKTTWVDWS